MFSWSGTTAVPRIPKGPQHWSLEEEFTGTDQVADSLSLPT